MINSTLVSLYALILIFAILYLNKDKLKTIFLRFKKFERKKYVKICPNCGSIDIKTDFSNPAVWAYGTPSKYKCNSCGRLGFLFPEIPEDNITQYQNKIKTVTKGNKTKPKSDLIDVATGFFAGMWDVIVALFVLSTLFVTMLFYFINTMDFSIFLKNFKFTMFVLVGTLLLIYITFRTITYIKNR